MNITPKVLNYSLAATDCSRILESTWLLLTTAMTKLCQPMSLVNREVSIDIWRTRADITAVNWDQILQDKQHTRDRWVLVTVSSSLSVSMLTLCHVAPAHRKRERERQRYRSREKESTLATCTYPTKKGCIMGNRLSRFALKIVVHSVEGSRHLQGVQLNPRNQLPTVAFMIKDNSWFRTKKLYIHLVWNKVFIL